MVYIGGVVMHSHFYLGKTSIDDGHWHDYIGMTSMDPDDPGHIHYMAGHTSYEDGHVHDYKNATGPAIYVEGKHYHMYSGITGMADGHVHIYEDATDKYHDAYYTKCPMSNEMCAETAPLKK